jgi:hypothetical protein
MNSRRWGSLAKAVASVRSQPDGPRRRPIIEELDPRILYSADLLPLVPNGADTALPMEQRTITDDGEFVAIAQRSASPSEVHSSAHEITFVDADAPRADELLADIQVQRGAGRDIEIVMLSRDGDGIAEITDALSQRQGVSAIHIVGYGTDGEVELGCTRLHFDSLLANAGRIKQWGGALSDDADLLLYGCDVAKSDAGRALVDALSRLTGADVAASEDATGNTALGGDWNLEYYTGEIATPIVLGPQEQTQWMGLLAEEQVVPATEASTRAASICWI